MEQHIHASPFCRRCQQTMTLHGTETIEVEAQTSRMEIFRCDTCGRMTAREADRETA